MAFSWQEQRLPAGAQTVPVEIRYLDRSYIHLYINGVEVLDFTWDSNTLIRFDRALEQESTVLLVRRTNREYLYLMFAEGAAFIKQNLDTQNLQFLHLSQELVEGRAIDGFFGSINMNGYTITNLGAGVNPTDAINKEQLDVQTGRIDVLQSTFVQSTNSYPWYSNTQVQTSTLTPPYSFTKAALYLNGVCQTPDYSYIVVDNTIMLANPVPAGTHIFARLGEDILPTTGYATTDALAANTQRLQAIEDAFNPLRQDVTTALNTSNGIAGRVDAVEDNVTTLQSSKADRSTVTALAEAKADRGDSGLAQLGAGTTGTMLFKASSLQQAQERLSVNNFINSADTGRWRDAVTGFTVMWGTTSGTQSSSTLAISFAVPFTAVFSVQLTRNSPTNLGEINVNPTAVGTTVNGFTLHSGSKSDDIRNISWVAYGIS